MPRELLRGLTRAATGDEGEVGAAIASPLELLLPEGVAGGVRVLGDSCPTWLQPRPRLVLPSTSTARLANLIIVAPTRLECTAPGWLDRAVDRVDRHLAIDGLAYLLVPGRWRWRLQGLLRARGLSLLSPIAHLPDWTSTRYLVPLDPPSIRYVSTRLLPTPGWRRLLSLAALRLPVGAAALGAVLPWTGLVARRPEARPLLDWLFRFDQDTRQPRGAVLTLGRQGRGGSVVLHRLSGSTHPSAIAKTAWGQGHLPRYHLERAALARLGPAARAAGARIPVPLHDGPADGPPVSLQSVVRGELVASLLARQPMRLTEIMALVARWLESWNRATRQIGSHHREEFPRQLLAAASILSPLVPDGETYREWLVERSAAVGSSMPLVAAHNDLTTMNLLLDEGGQLGVVDWEEASDQSLPLADFVYSTVDAALATRAYTGRLHAFEACFAPWGAHFPAVSRLLARLRAALELPDDAVDLCLHGCFLAHAANEHHRSGAGDPRPFLEIVRWMAANRWAVKGWLRG